jgi:hypothetical protein
MVMFLDKSEAKRDVYQRTHFFVLVAIIDPVKWNLEVMCKLLTHHEL